MPLTRGVIAETTDGVIFTTLSIPQGTGEFELPFNTAIGSVTRGTGGQLWFYDPDGVTKVMMFLNATLGSGNITVTFPQTGGELVIDAATQTLTNKTLTAPRIADGGFIADANGNEMIICDTVPSAINEITVRNAAISGFPRISATGGDTNINLELQGKGTGIVDVIDGMRVNGDLSVTGAVTGATINGLAIAENGGNALDIAAGETFTMLNPWTLANGASTTTTLDSDNFSPPATNAIGAPTLVYGATGGPVLSDPDRWIKLTVGGTDFVIPAYQA